MIFIFATELEAQHFREACPDATIVICGVGCAECAATTADIITQMRGRGEDQTLILAGIAGSYSLEDVAIGEIVEVISEQISALPSRFAVDYQIEPQTSLRHVSSNTVNKEAESPTNAQIENMEGASFMAVCLKTDVKCMQIRAISNKVGDPFATWEIDKACLALKHECSKLFETRSK